MNSPGVQRASPRVPVIVEVDVLYEEFEEMVTQVTGNVSLDGMFIRTSQPQPPGTGLEFQLRLAGGPRLIRGVAEVAWSRDESTLEGQPAGMGVRFIALDPDSRRLVRWLVERGEAGAAGAQAADAGDGADRGAIA